MLWSYKIISELFDHMHFIYPPPTCIILLKKKNSWKLPVPSVFLLSYSVYGHVPQRNIKGLLWSNHEALPLYSAFSFSSPSKLHSFSSSRKSCGFFVCLFVSLFFEILSLYCSLKSLPLQNPIFSRGGLRRTLKSSFFFLLPLSTSFYFFLLFFLLVPTQLLWS